MATTDEEQRTTTVTPLNDGAEGSGPLVPTGGTPAPRDDAAPAAPNDYLDEPMTLQEHLGELRDRLIRTVIGVVIGMVGGFFVSGRVLRYFQSVLKRADPDAILVQYGPTEAIVVYFKIAFYFGIALAMPIIIFQLIRFLAPGLTRTEKRYVYLSLPFIVFFFVLGVAFASLVAIPNMLVFLLEFSKRLDIANHIRIEEQLGFFLNLSLWTGIVFEMPVVMFLLASLNIVSYQLLRKTRKYASVGLMILAAVITPTPDALSMLIVWAPMYVLYELGLLLARFARPRKRAEPTA